MAERPSFQFYPGAWRNNANLRRCSYAARAVWVDILCILHDSDEYGVLRWPLVDIANAANAPSGLVQELVDKGVLKGGDLGPVTYEHAPRHARQEGEPVTLVRADDGPCWYSSRMLVDEWRRKTKGVATRFTGKGGSHPSPSHSPSRSPNHRQGDGSSSSTSSSKVSKKKEPPAIAEVSVAAVPDIALPDWVSPEAWQGYCEMRKRKRAPMTERAEALVLKKLEQLRLSGQDPNAVLDQSTQNAWIDVFELKNRDGRFGKATANNKPFTTTVFEPTDKTGWRDRLRVWKDSGRWLPKWGPEPSQPGCKCPPELLVEAIGEHAAPKLLPDSKSESPTGVLPLPGIGRPRNTDESVRAC